MRTRLSSPMARFILATKHVNGVCSHPETFHYFLYRDINPIGAQDAIIALWLTDDPVVVSATPAMASVIT